MAATSKQIDANRRNAQKSTGPRTPEGKARVSLNALRHGLAAAPGTILPHENRAEYEDMKSGLIESWQPANAQEFQLVAAIADGWLRMERSRRFEAALFSLNTRALKRRRRLSNSPSPGDDIAIAVALGDPDRELAQNQLLRYRKAAESAYYRAMDHLRALQNDRLRREQQDARIAAEQTRYVTIPAETPARPARHKAKATESKARMGLLCDTAPATPSGVVPIRQTGSEAARNPARGGCEPC